MDPQVMLLLEPLGELWSRHRLGQGVQLHDEFLSELVGMTRSSRLWEQASDACLFPGSMGRVKGRAGKSKQGCGLRDGIAIHTHAS